MFQGLNDKYLKTQKEIFDKAYQTGWTRSLYKQLKGAYSDLQKTRPIDQFHQIGTTPKGMFGNPIPVNKFSHLTARSRYRNAGLTDPYNILYDNSGRQGYRYKPMEGLPSFNQLQKMSMSNFRSGTGGIPKSKQIQFKKYQETIPNANYWSELSKPWETDPITGQPLEELPAKEFQRTRTRKIVKKIKAQPFVPTIAPNTMPHLQESLAPMTIQANINAYNQLDNLNLLNKFKGKGGFYKEGDTWVDRLKKFQEGKI